MMEMAQGFVGLLLMGLAVRASRKHSKATKMEWRVLNSALGAIGVWCLLSAASSFIPVVVEVRARIVGSAPQSVDIHLVGNKVRECYYRNVYAQVVQDGIAYDAAAEWLDDPSPKSTRPLGVQSFGVARITWPAALQPTQAAVFVQSDCGGWWITHTEMARIDLQ